MKAWKLFKSSKNWCQGTYAVNSHGRNVDYYSTDAVAFDATGAIRRVYKNNSSTEYGLGIKLLDYVSLKTRFDTIPKWNDHKNQRWKKVKAVLKKLNI